MSKTILITGASSGIGLATAHYFAQYTWNLILTGRNNVKLLTVKKEIEEQYAVQVQILCFDIQNKEATKKAIQTIQAETIDVLLNNAGLALGLSEIQNGDENDWEVMIDTNVKGLLNMSKYISQKMIAQGFGHIINLSSSAGKEVYPNGAVYCATKHAVDAITKGMRMDLYKHNIRVSSVSPGMVETNFSNVRFKGDEVRAAQVYSGVTPLSAQDIADVIYYIATRPAHVNIQDVLLFCADQASATQVNRKG